MRSHNIQQAWPLLHTTLSSLVLAVLISSAGTASAGGPARTSLGEGLPAGTVIDLGVGPCEFPLSLTIVVNEEYDLTFPEDTATQTQRHLVNGRLVVTATNQDSDRSVTRNVSGPGDYLYSTNPDDCAGPTGCSFHLSAQGSWLFFFFPDQRGPGTPGALIVNNGLIEEDQAPDGTQTISKQTGTVEDLCAVLR